MMAYHEMCDCFGAGTSDRLSKYILYISHDKQLVQTEENSALPHFAVQQHPHSSVAPSGCLHSPPFHLSIIALTHEKYIK